MVKAPASQWKVRHCSCWLLPDTSLFMRSPFSQAAIQVSLPSRCSNNALFGITATYIKGQDIRISSAVNETKFNVAELIKLRSRRVETSAGCGKKQPVSAFWSKINIYFRESQLNAKWNNAIFANLLSEKLVSCYIPQYHFFHLLSIVIPSGCICLKWHWEDFEKLLMCYGTAAFCVNLFIHPSSVSAQELG